MSTRGVFSTAARPAQIAMVVMTGITAWTSVTVKFVQSNGGTA
jgi:hypothetical protein